MKKPDPFLATVLSVALLARAIMLYLRFGLGISAVTGTFGYLLNLYGDFTIYYLPWLHSLQLGQIPYKDFFYQSPPLFLYSLYPAYDVAGAIGVASVLILADSGTAAVLYFIVREFSGAKTGFAAGLAYALSPFALAYEGFSLLDIQPMLFFLIMSLLLLRKNRLLSSSIFLAISVLFNQEAIAAAPGFLAYLAISRKFPRASVIRAGLLFAFVLAAVSLPFLIASPANYVNSVLFRTISYPTVASTGSPGPAVSCSYSQNLREIIETCAFAGSTSVFTSLVPLSYSAATALNALFQILYVPLALLVLPALYVYRKASNFLEVAVGYSIAASLMLFVVSGSAYVGVDFVARYVYLPVYAVLLLSGSNWKTPVTVTAISLLSLFIPPGAVQSTIPFMAVLAVMVVNPQNSRDSTPALGQAAEHLLISSRDRIEGIFRRKAAR